MKEKSKSTSRYDPRWIVHPSLISSITNEYYQLNSLKNSPKLGTANADFIAIKSNKITKATFYKMRGFCSEFKPFYSRWYKEAYCFTLENTCKVNLHIGKREKWQKWPGKLEITKPGKFTSFQDVSDFKNEILGNDAEDELSRLDTAVNLDSRLFPAQILILTLLSRYRHYRSRYHEKTLEYLKSQCTGGYFGKKKNKILIYDEDTLRLSRLKGLLHKKRISPEEYENKAKIRKYITRVEIQNFGMTLENGEAFPSTFNSLSAMTTINPFSGIEFIDIFHQMNNLSTNDQLAFDTLISVAKNAGAQGARTSINKRGGKFKTRFLPLLRPLCFKNDPALGAEILVRKSWEVGIRDWMAGRNGGAK